MLVCIKVITLMPIHIRNAAAFRSSPRPSLRSDQAHVFILQFLIIGLLFSQFGLEKCSNT